MSEIPEDRFISDGPVTLLVLRNGNTRIYARQKFGSNELLVTFGGLHDIVKVQYDTAYDASNHLSQFQAYWESREGFDSNNITPNEWKKEIYKSLGKEETRIAAEVVEADGTLTNDTDLLRIGDMAISFGGIQPQFKDWEFDGK